MGLITRFRKWIGLQTEGASIVDILRDGVGRDGQIINPRTILRHPAVWRGVDLISTAVARIPFELFERTENGSRVSAVDHDSYWLLKGQPNGLYSRFQMFRCWVVNTMTHGDGFIWIERDEMFRPIGLWLLDSAETSIGTVDGELVYMTKDRFGRRRALDAEDVAHLRGLGNDGMTGLPIYRVLADAFGLGMTLQRYQNVFFKNAGRPGVVIKLPPEVNTREQIEEFREAWGAVHDGVENAFKPAMLRPGADIKELPSDNAIEALANLREHDLVTIANALGIVPHRLGAKVANNSYGSLEQENLSFVQDIDGWVTQAEQELSLKLLRIPEQRTHYIEGNRDRLVQVDSKTKSELLALYRRNGMMSDQEIRRKLNLPDDFDLGTFWVEANLMERSKALAPKPLAPATEPAKPTTEDPDPNKPEQLAIKLTESIVGRLVRRAVKAEKLELNLWQAELGELPGYARIADRIQSTSIDKLEPQQIARELWTAT